MGKTTLLAVSATLALLSGQAALAQAVSVDTPEKTAGGATFTLPKASSLTSKPGVMIADAPESDAHIAIVDIDSAPDAPEWGTEVASRKNDDGSLCFVSITPTLIGFEFVAGEKGGKRTLTTRDGQHEYVYVEN